MTSHSYGEAQKHVQQHCCALWSKMLGSMIPILSRILVLLLPSSSLRVQCAPDSCCLTLLLPNTLTPLVPPNKSPQRTIHRNRPNAVLCPWSCVPAAAVS